MPFIPVTVQINESYSNLSNEGVILDQYEKEEVVGNVHIWKQEMYIQLLHIALMVFDIK
jgi:hypothetical protein